METDKITELMEEILNEEPMTIYKEPTNEINSAQNQALAECYAKEGFRKYMENAINLMIKNAAIRKGTDYIDGIRRGKIIALKQLLSVSGKAYRKHPVK